MGKTMSSAKAIELEQAQAFLANHLATAPTAVTLLGEGAWSRCFGFRQGEQELVIRFGNHVDDFQKDQLAYAYATPDLPIPKVYEIGPAFGGYYAISTRVYGVPLEQLDADAWLTIVPALVTALEAMRLADLSATAGWGGWDSARIAPDESWSSRLLSVDIDSPSQRTHGWRARLATSPQGAEDFSWGYDLLKQVVSDRVPRSLLHCDLVNRNVLVHGDQISGVFDWGCSIYGDHLYELAWFEFWAPWYPQLDVGYLRSALEQRWLEIGYAPPDKAARLLACYLHIGLDHLAYNAYLGDWSALAATAAQMRVLATKG